MRTAVVVAVLVWVVCSSCGGDCADPDPSPPADECVDLAGDVCLPCLVYEGSQSCARTCAPTVLDPGGCGDGFECVDLPGCGSAAASGHRVCLAGPLPADLTCSCYSPGRWVCY